MDKMFQEEYFDGLVENVIAVDQRDLDYFLNGKGNKNKNEELGYVEKTFNDLYMDDLIETAIGVEPNAMYEVLKQMESILPQMKQNKKTVNVNINTINETFMDDLVETAIGIEPEAMYQVLKRMESITDNENTCKHDGQIEKAINEIYLDNMIETAIGIEQTAMYGLIHRMDAITQTEVQFKDTSFGDDADQKLNAAADINTKTIIDLLNRMEERLNKTERNLAELKAVI